MGEEFDPYFKWLGIPPEQQPPHHYRLLGLPEFTDDADVISHAVDRLMTHLRTFQSGPKSKHSQKLLNEISTARVCLLNPESKAAYDEQLQREVDAQPQPADISEEVPDSSPTPASEQTETPMAMDTLPTGPQIQTKSTTVVSKKYKSQRRKNNIGMVLSLVGLVVVALVLGYVVLNMLQESPGSDSVFDDSTSAATVPAAATAVQKKKLADIDQNADGKVIIEEYLAAQGRDFERRDKDKDGALSTTEYPGAELIDKNGDGKLDREEYNARMEVNFGSMDMNEDGVLTADEM